MAVMSGGDRVLYNLIKSQSFSGFIYVGGLSLEVHVFYSCISLFPSPFCVLLSSLATVFLFNKLESLSPVAHVFYFLFSLGEIRSWERIWSGRMPFPQLGNGSKNIPSPGKGIFYREAHGVLHMITHSLSLPKSWRDSFSDLHCEKLLGLLEWKPWINGANSKNVVPRHFSLCDYSIFSLQLRSLWLH